MEVIFHQDGQGVRKRAAHKNSLNGCRTCKKRHVKCDEAVPACRRCQTSGRTCEGYAPLPADGVVRRRRRSTKFEIVMHPYSSSQPRRQQQSNSEPSSPGTIISLPSPSPERLLFSDEVRQEHSRFDFFFDFSIPLLKRSRLDTVWAEIKSDLLGADVALRHTVVAFALRHQSLALSLTGNEGNETAEACSLAYSRSLNSFRELLSRDDFNMRTAITTCLLFVVMESMAGNRDALHAHLCAGAALLARCNDRPDVRALLLNLVLNTLLQSHDKALHGAVRKLLPPWRPETAVKWDFAALSTTVATLITETYEFAVHMQRGLLLDLDLRQRMQDELLSRFDEVEYILDGDMRIEDSEAPLRNIVRARLLVARALLKGCATKYQTSYDVYRPQLKRALDLIEAFLRQHLKDDTWPFAVDSGITHSLQLIGHVNRDARQRRRALCLLKLAPQREGIWDAVESCAVVSAVMAFEETGLPVDDENGGFPPFIPEERRVHLAFFVEGPGHDGRRSELRLLYRPYAEVPGFQEVTVPLIMDKSVDGAAPVRRESHRSFPPSSPKPFEGFLSLEASMDAFAMNSRYGSTQAWPEDEVEVRF